MHSRTTIYGTIVALFLVSLLGQTLSFVLEGTSTSYAQFHKWNAGLNGSLEFEFKTDQGNGLLLYTDDGGTYDFFEVKLVESALRLRYNLGGGAQIVTVGRELGDGHWHKVQITRDNENTTINVDGVGATSTSRGKEFEFGKLSGNSDVYVGGMPSWYNSKLTLLALPSVIFEPRFNGFIRNLVYADGENVVPRRQEIKSQDAKVRFTCDWPSLLYGGLFFPLWRLWYFRELLATDEVEISFDVIPISIYIFVSLVIEVNIM